MRSLLIILLFVGVVYTQSPQEWWAKSTPEQKAFAGQCYNFGKQYGRGHSLAAIAWMESSLGRDIDHEEDSFGAFGILQATARAYRLAGSPAFIHNKSPNDGTADAFERGGRMAITIFEDNIRYFRRLGHNPGKAYFWAYPRYNAGNKWRRFERRGEVFNARVRHLKKIFK